MISAVEVFVTRNDISDSLLSFVSRQTRYTNSWPATNPLTGGYRYVTRDTFVRRSPIVSWKCEWEKQKCVENAKSLYRRVSFYGIALVLTSQALALFYHCSEQPFSTRRIFVGQIFSFFLSKSATVCLFGGLLYLYVVDAYNVLPKSIKLTLKVISLSAINERVPWWKNELARQWFGRNRTIWFMYLVTTPGILVCRQFLYYIVWTLILFATPLKLALAQIQPSSWIIVVTRDEYFIKPTTGWTAFRSCAIIKLLQETIYYFL